MEEHRGGINIHSGLTHPYRSENEDNCLETSLSLISIPRNARNTVIESEDRYP